MWSKQHYGSRRVRQQLDYNFEAFDRLINEALCDGGATDSAESAGTAGGDAVVVGDEYVEPGNSSPSVDLEVMAADETTVEHHDDDSQMVRMNFEARTERRN